LNLGILDFQYYQLIPGIHLDQSILGNLDHHLNQLILYFLENRYFLVRPEILGPQLHHRGQLRLDVLKTLLHQFHLGTHLLQYHLENH
jgi:hypothetical protein